MGVMVPMVATPWGHPGHGAPPLMPGPPPHMVMMPAHPGGMMGAVPPWGVGPYQPSPAPLMPIPPMGAPMAQPGVLSVG